MTLQELSAEYRAHARTLAQRIRQLEEQLANTGDEAERSRLQNRIHMLSVMHREARELAVLTERYYDRGYRRSADYTI